MNLIVTDFLKVLEKKGGEEKRKWQTLENG